MKRRLLIALAAAGPALCAWPAAAQAPYPTKPVRIVVPFAPGGPVDLLGRAAAQHLGETLGQPAIVENKVGAAGNIGVDAVAKAAPDGHTLGVVPVGNIAVNPALFPNLPYKAADLVPVAMLATVENVLVVNAGTPAANLRELIALARQKPDVLSFASPGPGSQAHLAGELLAQEAQLQLVHVPYKGVAPAVNDLVGGQVTMMFAQASSAIPFVQSGKLRAIGVASLRRSAALPNVPTVAEQGLPGFEAVSWYALMAPAGTPAEVVERLNAEMARLLAKPEMKEKFAALGMEAGSGKPQEIAARIRSESARWAELVRKRNIKPE